MQPPRIESSTVHRLLSAGLVTAVAATALACTSGQATGSGRTGAHRASDRVSVAAGANVRHVFIIVLENENYKAAYVDNKNPWLGRKLQNQGTLLTQYYGIGHNSLDNYLAMISGQAPNPTTSGDCPTYTDFQPSPAQFDPNGQAIGMGCVYPANVKTLADQLEKRGISWGGYMDDMGNDTSREPKRCGQPGDPSGAGTSDHTQGATAKDQYAARHNPFVYFHTLLDTGLCKQHVVPLTALKSDLKQISTTPRFTFITPNLCNDGHDTNCAGPDATGSKAGGLVSMDHFLSVWVPRIKQSPAFKRDGLIIITSDEAETGDDASACCNEQPGPSDPSPGIHGPGGGRIGALVIGHCVGGDRKVKTPYNHYSLLRSLENLFGVRKGGFDGKGHLGFAGASGLKPFGRDVFNKCSPT
jgi:phosphatidylinositol-3-phosphatase